VRFIILLGALVAMLSISPSALSNDMGLSSADQRTEDFFKDYFKRKNGLSEANIEKDLSEEDFIIKELGRERRISDYVSLHPEVTLGREFYSNFDISAKRIKLKYLIGALSRLGARIYLSPNSKSGDIVKDIVLRNKNIRDVGIVIATEYGASIRYFRTSGIYVVE